MEVSEAAKLLANQMIEAENNSDCGDLVIEWAKEFYWGHKVYNKAYPLFLELLKHCKDNNFNSHTNSLTLGDWDYSVWFEECKERDVLVVKDNSLCKVNSTFVYSISKGYQEYNKDLFFDFHCIAVYDKEIKRKNSYNDHRDVELASLETLKESKFYWGYRDGRDKGHCFNSNGTTRVEKPHWDELSVDLAIKELSYCIEYMKN